jgi:hypothetical protein
LHTREALTGPFEGTSSASQSALKEWEGVKWRMNDLSH